MSGRCGRSEHGPQRFGRGPSPRGGVLRLRPPRFHADDNRDDDGARPLLAVTRTAVSFDLPRMVARSDPGMTAATSGRAALYHRVSTLDQDPTLARRELRAALVVGETGSGARNDRPGLQRVMGAARRGDVDAVLAWKLDRFGRSARDVLANIRDLDSAGVRFVVTIPGHRRPAGAPTPCPGSS